MGWGGADRSISYPPLPPCIMPLSSLSTNDAVIYLEPLSLHHHEAHNWVIMIILVILVNQNHLSLTGADTGFYQ